MNLKRKKRTERLNVETAGIMTLLLIISLTICITHLSCREDPLNPSNGSGSNNNQSRTDDEIDWGAASRCDDVYSWDDADCWEDISTIEKFHKAVVCSYEALSNYYICLKEYANFPADYCDCYSSCYQITAKCCAGCPPGNPALEEQTCLDGCMVKAGDCFSVCRSYYPSPF